MNRTVKTNKALFGHSVDKYSRSYQIKSHEKIVRNLPVMRKLRAKGWTFTKIAAKYGVSENAISNYLSTKKNRPSKPLRLNLKRVAHYYSNHTIKQSAKHFRVSYGQMKNYLDYHKITHDSLHYFASEFLKQREKAQKVPFRNVITKLNSSHHATLAQRVQNVVNECNYYRQLCVQLKKQKVDSETIQKAKRYDQLRKLLRK